MVSWQTIHIKAQVGSLPNPHQIPNQPFHPLGTKQKNLNTTKMMFSKLSIFVAATLAAFATAAGPLPQQGGPNNVASNPQTDKPDVSVTTLSCPSGPVKWCESYFTSIAIHLFISFFLIGTDKHQATADEAKRANDKLSGDINAGAEVWIGCIDFVPSQGKTWYDCLII